MMSRFLLPISGGAILIALITSIVLDARLPVSHAIIIPIDRTQYESKPRSLADPLAPDDRLHPRSSPDEALHLAHNPHHSIQETATPSQPKMNDSDEPRRTDGHPVIPAMRQSDRPKLALVIIRSGISEALTREASKTLPANVTFSISAYATNPTQHLNELRDRGHEVFLDVQSVASDPKIEDRGPLALDPLRDQSSNRERLDAIMDRMSGYVGVIADLTPEALQQNQIPLLLQEKADARSLLLIHLIRPDSTQFNSLSSYNFEANPEYDLEIIPRQSPRTLGEALDHLVMRTNKKRNLILCLDPAPLAIDVLKNWIDIAASREFDLVPLSALMRPKKDG